MQPSLQPSDLHVISVCFNPQRFKSRYAIFKPYAQRIEDKGVQHWICEAAFGDRPFEVTSPDNPRHIQVRVRDELWIKEALINRAVQALPMDWRYVMVNDADIRFVRHDWPMETLHALQHYAVIQPWSDAVNLGPNREVLRENGSSGIDRSFASCHLEGFEQGATTSRPTGYGYNSVPFFHPGYSWAYRREAWDGLGGLIDGAILGAADHHMACCLIGKARNSMPEGLTPAYRQMVTDWEYRALKNIKRNLGCVPGTILHFFHGYKANRRYRERWEILQRNEYDPTRDIFYDFAGIPKLNDEKYQLRDDIRRYFKERQEDTLL
jgi:hypothetical protein